MKIRKKFKVESAHIVRNCYTERCKKSIHGHSAEIEVVLQGNHLDNAGMLMDFTIVNKLIKPFIDSMDHTMIVWRNDSKDYVESIMKYSDRVMILDVNPSAENLAIFIHTIIDYMLKNTKLNNNEGTIRVHSVKYHETQTGYAETERSDIYDSNNQLRPDIVKFYIPCEFSLAITEDWTDELHKVLINKGAIELPTPEQTVSNLHGTNLPVSKEKVDDKSSGITTEENDYSQEMDKSYPTSEEKFKEALKSLLIAMGIE